MSKESFRSLLELFMCHGALHVSRLYSGSSGKGAACWHVTCMLTCDFHLDMKFFACQHAIFSEHACWEKIACWHAKNFMSTYKSPCQHVSHFMPTCIFFWTCMFGKKSMLALTGMLTCKKFHVNMKKSHVNMHVDTCIFFWTCMLGKKCMLTLTGKNFMSN